MTRAIFLLAAAASLLAAAEPIRLHPRNPRYFEWRGKPAILVTSGEHYGSVLNLDFDYLKYLDTLQKDGLNYTRLFPGTYREVPGSFGIERNNLAPLPGRFLSPWPEENGRFDLTKWNEAYFKRLKDFVSAAGSRGIVVEVTLFTSTYANPQWAVHPFRNAGLDDFKKLNTLDNGKILTYQEALVRRLVRELNPFDNVTFEIQNEPWADRPVVADVINPYIRPPATRLWPNSVDLADDASLAWQAQVSAWITSEEEKLPQRHLIAQNVCNFQYPVKALVPGVSIINFHYAYPQAALWNLYRRQPIACDETGFMGPEDRHYRIEAWRFVLAGGALFNNLDYSFSPGFENGTDVQPKSPGGGSPALRKQLGTLKRFVEGLPFLEMMPDAGLVLGAPGAWVQAFSKPGAFYAVHITGTGPLDLTLDLPAGKWLVEWLDPVTGTPAKTGARIHSGGVVLLTTPAFSEDIVLRLQTF
jgi:hypothetical protein